MRTVSSGMTTAWLAEDKTGPERRPVVRATIQVIKRQSFDYDLGDVAGGDTFHRTGHFSSLLFGQNQAVREIPNIQSCDWTRGVNQDVAECTLTLLNAEIVPLGQSAGAGYEQEFERPGYLTYNRGLDSNPWGYDDNGWRGILVPDRMVRTYEGYGCDPTVVPGLDPHLEQSGVWLIDDVTYTDAGTIEVHMRDVGRYLMEMISFPGNIPGPAYPMRWEKRHTESKSVRVPSGGSWKDVSGTTSSSNKFYVGKNIPTSDGSQYVDSSGVWQGHRSRFPLADDATAWFSTGQQWPDGGTRVWWQVEMDSPKNIAAVRVKVPKYLQYVYVSVATADGWVGKRKIAYDHTATGDVDLQAGIPYVAQAACILDEYTEIVLPKTYKAITKIRITIRRLGNYRIDSLHPWRGVLERFQVYSGSASDLAIKKGTTHVTKGNMDDYADAARWILAWAGFYWPAQASGRDYMKFGNDVSETYYFHDTATDPELPVGSVWADIMPTGTTPTVPLTEDQFDKQPLMDCLRSIADMLGYGMWVDETGAFIFRMLNIWKQGNFLTPNHLDPTGGKTRTTDYVTISDENNLLSYSTTLSSANNRERIFVSSVTGKPGTIVDGYKPFPQGFNRIAGYTDLEFGTAEDCEVMADMIVSQQVFAYKSGSVTIPGYPAIQVDDQVKILERVTNETYYHYVESISSSLDMRTGTWTYTLGTHWLGNGDATDGWVVDAQGSLSPALQQRLISEDLL